MNEADSTITAGTTAVTELGSDTPNKLGSSSTEQTRQKLAGLIRLATQPLAILFFRICLDISYVFYVEPAFFNDPITPMRLNFDTGHYIISLALMLIPALLIPYHKRDISGIFFMSAMIFYYIPSTSMFGLNLDLPIEPVLHGLTALIIARLFSMIPLIPLPPSPAAGSSHAATTAMVAIGCFVAWSVLSGAINNINLDLFRIYLFRERSSELLDIGILSYLNLWTQKIFAPFLMAYALARRNKALVAFTIFIHFYFFAVTQHRIHLFVPILVYVVYLLYSKPIQLTSIYVYCGVGCILAVASSIYFSIDSIGSLLIRRALYVAPSVAFDWYKYFQDHDFIWWTDRYLLWREAGIYTGVNLSLLLGEWRLPGSKLAFSVGLVGSGYAQGGFFGICLYAAVLGTVVNIFNRLIKHQSSPYIAAAIAIGPLRTAWADSELTTALLSHGIFVALFLIWLLSGSSSKPCQSDHEISSPIR